MESTLINIARNWLAYSSVLLATACSSNRLGVPTEVGATERNRSPAPCSLFVVSLAGDHVGTAFDLAEGSTRYILTAAHVVRGADERRLTLSSICSSERIPVTQVLYLPTIDVAVLVAAYTPVSQPFVLATSTPNWGAQLTLPGFPNISKGSTRFAREPIPADGRFVRVDESLLLMTADVVMKGSSGSPIISQAGEVLGILTNRIQIEGAYAGLSYGVNFLAIRNAIRTLPTPAN